MLLDVNRLPREAPYEGSHGRTIDMALVVMELQPIIEDLARLGLTELNESFGFAAGHPDMSSWKYWDSPYKFVWFVAGWGPDGDRCIANAVRKLRPALRLEKDGLDILLTTPRELQELVKPQNPDGTFEWGDLPWGGATFVQTGDIIIPCAVSSLAHMGDNVVAKSNGSDTAIGDDTIAKLIGGRIGIEMLKLKNPGLTT